MANFGRHWRTVSGAVVGFSAGAVTSVLLLKHFDKTVSAAAAATPSQLFSPRAVQREDPALAPIPFTEGSASRSSPDYEAAIRTCRELVLQTKEEMGIPGVCVAVNVNGKTVWTDGFGYSDVENAVPCTPKTVMRIASISKSITMAALAKLWEDGKVDLDQPVQQYVPNFPKKTFGEEPVEITTRMLVSHLSGIRHWKGGEERDPSGEGSIVREFYLNTHFESINQALSIFENDDILHKPGTKFLYSSPAWTLISAVMEKAAGATYREIMTDLFNQLGLKNTQLDLNDCITPNRARYYIRNKNGRLVNSPCVDNSCKWAGGGLQSTVGDLVKFGDAMLYCYQEASSGYLKKDTIDALWTVSPNTISKPKTVGPSTSGYGMGWAVSPALMPFGGVEPQIFSVNHTGGAVGASSVLLIVPYKSNHGPPSGVTVAITVNMQQIGLTRLATKISECFWDEKSTSIATALN